MLVGHSTGGLVAHALAAHLEELGRTPKALVLLDTPTVGEEGFSGDWPAFLDATLALTADYSQDDTWLTATVHYLSLPWQNVRVQPFRYCTCGPRTPPVTCPRSPTPTAPRPVPARSRCWTCPATTSR